MSNSGAAITYQQTPTYGEILSRSVSLPESNDDSELPGIGRYLSQAAFAGMFGYFLVVVVVVAGAGFYDSLFLVLLPVFLAMGFGFGILEGLLIWACSRIAGRRLNGISRLAIGVFFIGLLCGGVSFLYVETSQLEGYIRMLVSTASTGLTVALVTGSSLQPWRALVRGDETIRPKSAAVLAGLTGFILRSTIVFFFMESVLFLIWISQVNDRPGYQLWALVAAIHFTASSLIVFVRMRLGLLLTLALIVTAPLAGFVFEFQQELGVTLYVIYGYLAAWAMFLLTRWRRTYQAFSVITEEMRYYLID